MSDLNNYTCTGRLGRDPEKACEWCGDKFAKRPKDSQSQWEDRSFCSASCANKMSKTIPTHLYFWKYVTRGPDDECWTWDGVKDEKGYGRVHFMTSKIKAHRVAFEMWNGPIEDGMVICHKCDNPNHLFKGTQGDNIRDAIKKGRFNPNFMDNLRPGKKGIRGAGPKSNKELNDERIG